MSETYEITFSQNLIDVFIQVEGMKMMARWLLGLKTDEVAAQKTFRLLTAIIDNGGDLLEERKPNPAECAWLRLAAGCAMLKICEQKGVGDQLTTEQYSTLNKLVTDPVVQVRQQFLGKLPEHLKQIPVRSSQESTFGIAAASSTPSSTAIAPHQMGYKNYKNTCYMLT